MSLPRCAPQYLAVHWSPVSETASWQHLSSLPAINWQCRHIGRPHMAVGRLLSLVCRRGIDCQNVYITHFLVLLFLAVFWKQSSSQSTSVSSALEVLAMMRYKNPRFTLHYILIGVMCSCVPNTRNEAAAVSRRERASHDVHIVVLLRFGGSAVKCQSPGNCVLAHRYNWIPQRKFTSDNVSVTMNKRWDDVLVKAASNHMDKTDKLSNGWTGHAWCSHHLTGSIWFHQVVYSTSIQNFA